MTEALYMEDCYMRSCKAKVIEVNGLFVVTDKTIFYPESGGQPTDTGKFVCGDKEYKVALAKKISGNISHQVDKEGLKVGDEIEMVIDWDNRYKLMRYHTAAHIVSGVINKHTDAKITGNQLSLDKTRIDFNLHEFDRDLIMSFLPEMNKLVEEERAVNIRELPRDEAFKIESLFKLKDVLPPSIKRIRIVEIEGFDTQACGGTHVKNTKEVGTINITDMQNKGKDNRRLYFTIE
ncbi:alanyl-tRNA editing protein AlaX [Candidatus Woesearchaeota archaeon]|nr:alanyl-tRNA editing protein AlaX [Candidatus Woesearchaeota archaeon]